MKRRNYRESLAFVYVVKYLKCLLYIILFPTIVFSQSLSETNVRIKSKFNLDWKFVLEDKAGFESPTYDDSQWRSLNLPYDWSVEGEFDASNSAAGNGAFLPCGDGWY